MVQISTPWGDPNRGMGPPWGAFCQITLTSCWHLSYESLNDTRFSDNRCCTWPAGIALPSGGDAYWFLVLFSPHKQNKNIFINSGAIYQAKCNQSMWRHKTDRMRYILARWHPTIYSSAVRRFVINWHIQDKYVWLFIITVYQWILF